MGVPVFQYHLEWPPPGASVAGPIVWLRGWAVGTAGHELVDVRVRHSGRFHRGILGLPRVDLARHFGSDRPWLPAGFAVGVPLGHGRAELRLEVQDAFGRWRPAQDLTLHVASDGAPTAESLGRVQPMPDGTQTIRDTHLPFHGSLDDPKPDVQLRDGQAVVFGWLLHETQAITRVWSTTDLRIFRQLKHNLADDSLAQTLPGLRGAGQARLCGAADLSATLEQPASLRIYAELADGTVHLCLAHRVSATPPPEPALQPWARRLAAGRAVPAARRSGRPRRLLMSTLGLERDDGTLRALDVARHLTSKAQWGVRLLTLADGPMRPAFESAGVPVQIVDPQPFFSAASDAAAETALADLARQIWLRHLDAVAVFDPAALWLAALARRKNIPVVCDHSSEAPVACPGRIQPEEDLANLIIRSSASAARANQAFCPTAREMILRPWHGPAHPPHSPASPDGRRRMVVPVTGTPAHGAATLLQAADWLARWHPGFVSGFRIALTGLRNSDIERQFTRDVVAHQPSLFAIETLDLAQATACVYPGFASPPVRTLLDAAAIGVPIITTSSPSLTEIFPACEITGLPAGNPLALAHALADHAANPSAAARRAAAAQRRILTEHRPEPLLEQWQQALETTVASPG